MNSLTIEQLNLIKNYWEQNRILNSQIFEIEMFKESHCVYSKKVDHKIIADLNQELEDIRQQLDELNTNYEKMLGEHDIYLCDRSMNEDLFMFVNDGFIVDG